MTNLSHDELRAKALKVLAEYNKYVYGYEDIGQKLLIAIISGRVCHILTEGVPGLAKTHSVKVMSYAIDGMTSTRIQFTPDMMPKEITGAKILDLETRKSFIEWGPIVGVNLVVADEINRGKTNTQSALLESMGEGQVTVAGFREKMANPFVVMATQNPIEQEGTNPLPEAQHDRFLFKLVFDYADEEAELKILENPDLGDSSVYEKIKAHMTKDEVLEARAFVDNKIYASRMFNKYLLKVCRTTRPGKPEYKEFCEKHPELANIMKMVKVGVGPRALQGLQRACKVQAFLFGKTVNDAGEEVARDYVKPEDLKTLAHAVLRHRIIMKEEAAYNKGGAITSDDVIKVILDQVYASEDVRAYKR